MLLELVAEFVIEVNLAINSNNKIFNKPKQGEKIGNFISCNLL